jgi:hypothetical protein
MIGFSGIQITKIVFSKEAIERNEKRIIAFGVGMVLLSAAIGLGIYELNVESTHRNIQIIAGAIIYFIATIAFFKTVLSIGKGEVNIYNISPFLIIIIAFMIYGFDLIAIQIDATKLVVGLYVFSLALNCLFYTYSIFLKKTNKARLYFTLFIEAVIIILLINRSSAPSGLDSSIIIWATLFEFSASIILSVWIAKDLKSGNKIQAIQKTRLKEKSPRAEPQSNKAEIYIWLPDEEQNLSSYTIPIIGRYLAAYSFDQKRILTGHIAIKSEHFYASLNPRKTPSSSQEVNIQPERSQPLKNDDLIRRGAVSGYWETFENDIKKHGSTYHLLEVTIQDINHVAKEWKKIQKNSNYSLYGRNSATISTHLYDACIDSCFHERKFINTIIAMHTSSLFWNAVTARLRANLLAWSPGLAFDYIINLNKLQKVLSTKQ